MGWRIGMQGFHIAGLAKITVEIPVLELPDIERLVKTYIAPRVYSSAIALAARMQNTAPRKTGDLIRGIMASPTPERSSDPAKVYYDVYIDPAMNDTFVKVSKDGKRYYYPASQEYGFRVGKGRRIPGRYYMRDAAVETYAAHRDRVAEGLEEMLEELQ